MIPFKGQIGFRQYIKSKRTRFGINVWVLAESSSGYYNNINMESRSILKGKEQSFFSNNFILLNHKQICFITIYDGCLT